MVLKEHDAEALTSRCRHSLRFVECQQAQLTYMFGFCLAMATYDTPWRLQRFCFGQKWTCEANFALVPAEKSIVYLLVNTRLLGGLPESGSEGSCILN